jgi:hypothetical protein
VRSHVTTFRMDQSLWKSVTRFRKWNVRMVKTAGMSELWVFFPVRCTTDLSCPSTGLKNAPSLHTNVNFYVVVICFQRGNWNQPHLSSERDVFLSLSLVKIQGHLNYKRSFLFLLILKRLATRTVAPPVVKVVLFKHSCFRLIEFMSAKYCNFGAHVVGE